MGVALEAGAPVRLQHVRYAHPRGSGVTHGPFLIPDLFVSEIVGAFVLVRASCFEPKLMAPVTLVLRVKSLWLLNP